MINKRFPKYPDDTDYNTNSPSYYDDLARKQKLIQLLAEKIWEYEETLDLTLEEITTRLESYIEENDTLMNERLEQWDLNLEKFPENVELLLQEWLSDGTLDHIINETIFNWKADKTYVDSEIERLEQKDENITEQLAQTKPIKYLTDVPNITDLPEGFLGVHVKDEVKLAVSSVYPKNNATDVEIDTPIFIDFNMAIDLETVKDPYIRLMEDNISINLLLGVDHFKNRIVAYPVLAGQRLKPNTKYTIEITDGVRSVKGHSIGSNSLYKSQFTTGEDDSIFLNSTLSDYANTFDMITTAPATVTQLTNQILIDTRDGGSAQLQYKPESIQGPATVDYLLRITNTASTQLRLETLTNSVVFGFRWTKKTQDVLDTNVVNKQRPYSYNQYIHVRLAVDENDFCVAWVNGDRLDNFKHIKPIGRVLLLQNTSGLIELHRIKIWNSFKELG